MVTMFDACLLSSFMPVARLNPTYRSIFVPVSILSTKREFACSELPSRVPLSAMPTNFPSHIRTVDGEYVSNRPVSYHPPPLAVI